MTSPGWTSTEAELAQALIDGALFDLRDRADDAKQVRADVIRDLLLGRWPDGIDAGSTADPRGLRLYGASILGRLDLGYVSTDIGLELNDCAIPDGIAAIHARLTRLDLTGSALGHRVAKEPALEAEGFTVTGDVVLERVRARSNYHDATVRMLSGNVGGHLMFSGGTITNESGPALAADFLTIGGAAYLGDSFAATGSGDDGAVRLASGHIGSDLNFAGATLINESGPALFADGISVGNSASLGGGFAATGSGYLGAVRLRGGHIGSQLIFAGATLTNESGPAVLADRLTVGSSAYLNDGFSATGSGDLGAVRLTSGQINRELNLAGAALTNGSGPALIADALTIDGSAYLRGEFTAIGRAHRGTLLLQAVTVNKGLHIDITGVTSSLGPSHRLAVDGMTYRYIFDTSWHFWLDLLENATPDYAAQPYRQLATVTAAAGHDSDTRRVLMAQRKDQLARAGLKRRDRAWGWLTGLFLGHGYQSWRAIIFLLIVTVATVLLMALTFGARGLYDKDEPAAPSCSIADRIVLGVDTALPLVATSVGSTCLAKNNWEGSVITVAGLGAQLLGWAFATLFVAGFTSAVRKT